MTIQSRSTLSSPRLVVYILLLVTLAACAPQTMSGAAMAEANQHYETGAYSEAIAAYERLIDAGATDGGLYYNLANAHFKHGDLGRAILNYRRAQQLLPRDPDVATNLRIARAQTKDRLESEEQDGVPQFVARALVGWTTDNEIAIVALGLWILLSALIVIAILRSRHVPTLIHYSIGGVALLLALSLLSIGIRFVQQQQTPAVILADSVEIHSGPGTDYLTEFSLHAGTEVNILETREGWARLALPGDLQGWAPTEAVGMLWPEAKP